MAVGEATTRAWAEEQDLLRLGGEQSPRGVRAGGGLAAAIDPTVRVVVLPGDLSVHQVPELEPESVIPRAVTVPNSRALPYNDVVRGSSSGYIGLARGMTADCDASMRCIGMVASTSSPELTFAGSRRHRQERLAG